MRRHFGGLFVVARKDRLNDSDDKVKLLSVVSQNLESDDCSSLTTTSDNQSDKLRLLQVDHYGDPTTSDSDPIDNRNLSPPHISPAEGFANGGADLTSSQEFLDCPTFASPKLPSSPRPIPPPKQNTDVWNTEGSADKQEWIFTLYDFDGKGKVGHDDIVSLVRSIYEVLGQVKLPTAENPKNAGNMGAFRVKLTVVKEKPMGNHPQMYADPAEMDISNQTEFIGEPKRVSSKRGHYASPNLLHLNNVEIPIAPDADHIVGDTNNRQRSTYASIEEVLGLSNKRIKRQMLKPPKNVTYAVPTSRRHSYLHQRPETNPIRDENVCRPPQTDKPRNCHCCSEDPNASGTRDYVNLSELENCCTKGVANCASGEIHHIRHCDRHCACVPRMHRSRQYSELLNCSRNGVVSPAANGFCCQQPPTPQAVNKAVNEALREAQQTGYGRHPSRHLRNIAYYSHQVAKMSKSPVNGRGEAVRPAPIGASSPIYAAINQPAETVTLPQAQHIRKPHGGQRQKEKIRSMAAVQEWITKEPFDLCPPPNSVENPYDMPTKILHEHHHYHHYA